MELKYAIPGLLIILAVAYMVMEKRMDAFKIELEQQAVKDSLRDLERYIQLEERVTDLQEGHDKLLEQIEAVNDAFMVQHNRIVALEKKAKAPAKRKPKSPAVSTNTNNIVDDIVTGSAKVAGKLVQTNGKPVVPVEIDGANMIIKAGLFYNKIVQVLQTNDVPFASVGSNITIDSNNAYIVSEYVVLETEQDFSDRLKELL